MIDPKMIPDEVVEKAAEWVCCESPCQHPDGDTCCAKGYRDQARAAIAAALSAWPGAERIYRSEDERLFTILLPLSPEGDA